MPSIQIELPITIDPATKQTLAQRVGVIYGATMQVAMDLLTVSVHDLGEGASGGATNPAHPRRRR